MSKGKQGATPAPEAPVKPVPTPVEPDPAKITNSGESNKLAGGLRISTN